MAQRYVGEVGRLEQIVERLQPSLGAPSGAPVPLEGGITNRNFRVRLGTADYVVRLPGKDTALLGIDRTAERLAGETAARLGIAPGVTGEVEGCLVTRYVDALPVDPARVVDRVEEIARSLRRFHESGLHLPRRFWVPDLLDDYAAIVRGRGRALPPEYAHAVQVARRIAAVVPLRRPRPCHNDLLAGNILRTRESEQLLLVDWEYAGMGHPGFDLGNLSINNRFDDAADERLLSAYYQEPPTTARRATLRLMRVLSDVREAAWGVVQATVSELDFDFEGYASEHFERLQAAADSQRLGVWLAQAGDGRDGRVGQSA